MIYIIREKATPDQIHQMARLFEGVIIKLAVDVNQKIIAGGGSLHSDCEQALLDQGSQQANIWGADWFVEVQEVGFESIINIRPRQQNYGFELKNAQLRQQIELIVRQLLEI